MILGRILSNSSFKSSAFATAYLHYHSFIQSSFISNNVGHRIRCFSVEPRFDLERIRQPDDAVALFQEMPRMRPRPSVVEFTELLSVVVDMKQYSLALQLFDEMLHKDTSTKHNTLDIVMALFRKMVSMRPRPSVFDYNKFLGADVKIKQYTIALHLFNEMLRRDAPVDHRTLNVAINCFGLLRRPDLGFAILSIFFKRGHKPDVVTFSILIDAFCKEGRMEAVVNTLEMMKQLVVQPDIVTYNSLMKGYCLQGEIEKAIKVFDSAVNSGLKPNIVSYTTLMNGYCEKGEVDEVLRLFVEIPTKGLELDVVSFTMLLHSLQVCELRGDQNLVRAVHSHGIRSGLISNNMLRSSLLAAYANCGGSTAADAMRFFSEIHRDDAHRNEMDMIMCLKACSILACNLAGQVIHSYLTKTGFLADVIFQNALINVYAENGCHYSALLMFRLMHERDIISWTTIAKSFVENDDPAGALRLLGEIHRDDVRPDDITIFTCLTACSKLVLDLEGQVIHCYVMKTGFHDDLLVQNALINMYAKSGRLDQAEDIFKEISEPHICCWSSIMSAYGTNGDGASALKLFNKLVRSGTKKLDAITFIVVLSACAHAGLVQEGLDIFCSMEMRWGVSPGVKHFACVVDLLGRAGRVKEAEALIDTMPMPPDINVWGALLSGGVLVGDMTVVEKAAREVAPLVPNRRGWRTALSKAYAAVGKWDKAEEIRAVMLGSDEMVNRVGLSYVDCGRWILKDWSSDIRTD